MNDPSKKQENQNNIETKNKVNNIMIKIYL